MTIAVIGAGASGMMAALTAAEQPENKILLFERQARVGRKLAVTGNGRCNLTNTGAAPENYHGAQPDFAAPALAAFPPEAALRWFAAHGLMTVTEPGGRVYPLSNAANSVVDVLRFALARPNIALRAGEAVTAVRRWPRLCSRVYPSRTPPAFAPAAPPHAMITRSAACATGTSCCRVSATGARRCTPRSCS